MVPKAREVRLKPKMRKALGARCWAPTTAQRDVKRARKAVQKPPYHSTLIPGTSLLALELQELSLELNLDVTVTGFEMAEIDLVVREVGADDADEADVIPEINRSLPAVSRPHDRWQIGDHFLSCGDALEPVTYERLLDGKRAQLVFTDPPG